MSTPNILVFMTDQQHHATVLADHPCRTPRLDRLGARGVAFTHAFCPTPICTPTRASVQTGLLPHRHGLIHNTHKNYHVKADLAPDTPTLGSVLAAAGYASAYVGKWHVGRQLSPTDFGYERYLAPHGEHGPWEALSEEVRIPGEGRRAVISAATGQPVADHEAMQVAGAVCELLREPRDRPFFIFASTTAPHVPWLCPRDWADRIDPADIPRPPAWDDDMAGRPDLYRRLHNMHNCCRMPGRWPDLARALAHYYGIIELIDAAFGRILDTLEATGALENTLVVFCSDHGEMAGAHGIVGKGAYLLEDIIRTPLVIAGPGVSRQGPAAEFVSLTDLYATLLAAAGAAAEAPPESRDLAPLLRAPDPDWPREVFLEHHGALFHTTVRGLRTDEWKYVFRPEGGDELYDLRHDPEETVNRLADPACAHVLADLRARLLAWMESTADTAAAGARYVFGAKG